jgi:hypothetical protein
LDDADQQYRHRVDGKNKTHWRAYGKEWKEIAQLAAYVRPVERVLVVFPMQRIQTFVQKAPDKSFSWWKAAMKDMAME